MEGYVEKSTDSSRMSRKQPVEKMRRESWAGRKAYANTKSIYKSTEAEKAMVYLVIAKY